MSNQQMTAPLLQHNDMTYRKLEQEIKRRHEEIRQLWAVKYAKYPSSIKKKKSICPNLRKGFSSEASLVFFFKTMATVDSLGRRIPESNAKKLLLRQFFYGLRVGEVCSATYNPYTKLVRVQTEKMGQPRIDYIPFIEGTESLFECANVSKDCLRNLFRRHLHRLGGEYPDVYFRDKKGKDLHRLTTHSLRVTASNMLRKHTKDPFKQKWFLRHSIERAYGSSSHYMEYPEEEYRKDLNETFAGLVKALIGEGK